MLPLDALTDEVTVIIGLSLFSLLVAVLLTPIYSNYAFKHKLWKRSRTHSTTGEELKVISSFRIKRQIPLMAGIVTLIAVTLTTILFNLDRGQTWLPLAGFVGGGFVGLVDDIINIKGSGGNVAGLRPKVKFIMLTFVAAIAAFFFYYKLGYNTIHIPFAGDLFIGWALIPLFVLAVVSTGNAVNITDGMDGLAGGIAISSFGAFGVIAALQGLFMISGFCFTVIGALLAYLWFNIPPARFLMGDVGSFALGTSLGVVAMLTDTLFLLPIIAFVFVAETGSVILQLGSKKLFKKRIFKASPIHHHFEAMGWPKTKVTMRFWIVGQVCAVLGVALALLGGFIQLN